MAAKPINMDQIRSLLQQSDNNVSIRSMERNTGISRNTIRGYLRRIQEHGYSPKQALELNDQMLARICLNQDIAPRPPGHRAQHMAAWIAEHGKDLRKKHVTRQILWEEYRQEHPDGYGYTWFCRHLNEYLDHKEVTMVLHHQPGEKMMIDFAGDELSWVDRQTGEVMPAPVWVCVLPFSSYMYVQATGSYAMEDVADCFQNTVAFFGGVTQSVLFDNMKSVVKRADRYEPTFTELMEAMAVHYRATFMATRVRKPRDKASVETSVNVAYQRIYAKLRNRTFYSLCELNQAIRAELLALNARNFKGRDYSRNDLFENYEKPVLIDLPGEKFILWKRAWVKVQKNYHVILGKDMHQYSVPYRYAGKRVKLYFTATLVEIYHDLQRIALHMRNRSRYGYSTQADHMPSNHRAVQQFKGWNGNDFLSWANKIGPATRDAIAVMLDTRAFPEQTYNACLGVLRLAGKFGPQRLESVCHLLRDSPKITYRLIHTMLKNNRDQHLFTQQDEDHITVEHANVRGPESYQ